MKPIKEMDIREKLHMMIDMLDEAYLPEAENVVGSCLGKSMSDRQAKKRKKK